MCRLPIVQEGLARFTALGTVLRSAGAIGLQLCNSSTAFVGLWTDVLGIHLV